MASLGIDRAEQIETVGLVTPPPPAPAVHPNTACIGEKSHNQQMCLLKRMIQ